METLIIFFILVFGLIIGSFLNVLIYRLPRELNFVSGRSFCPKCKKKISWFDNIPLLSFILLKGKCRYCQKKISWQYPIIELTTGILTLLIFNFQFKIINQYQIYSLDFARDFVATQQFLNVQLLNFQTLGNLILSLFLVWGLIVIFVVDLQHQIIPDEIIIFLTILFLINLPITYHLTPNTLNYLLSALGSALFLYLIYLITYGKGMGLGDVKLAFLMGLVLGFPGIIVAFYIAFLAGAFIGVILLLLRKAKLGQKIPFGPFLVLGTFVSYFYGWQIINLVINRYF